MAAGCSCARRVLNDREREELPFDVQALDWESYWSDVHLPGGSTSGAGLGGGNEGGGGRGEGDEVLSGRWSGT